MTNDGISSLRFQLDGAAKTGQPRDDASERLFDSWFDPIESAVRGISKGGFWPRILPINNERRTHLSLDKDSPSGRAIQQYGAIVTTPILSGLHHCYARIRFSGMTPAQIRRGRRLFCSARQYFIAIAIKRC
ncbi:MAG: hypothetical protein WB822_14070 [Rhodoplanes sp.]